MKRGLPDIEILLVEDDSDDTELTIHALKQSNKSLHLHRLKDGVEALHYLLGKRQENGAVLPLPRLVLLDLKLPKVDGLEVLRKIRENARTRMLPVVILTSSAQKRDISDAYKLGVNSYVVKPVEFDSFVEKVSAVAMYWSRINTILDPTLAADERIHERNLVDGSNVFNEMAIDP